MNGTSFQILLFLSCFELGWENVSLLPGFCQQSTYRPYLEGLRGPKGGGQNRHGSIFPDTNALFIRAADVCHMGFKQPVLQRRLLGPRGLGHPSRLGVVSRLCSQTSTWGSTRSPVVRARGELSALYTQGQGPLECFRAPRGWRVEGQPHRVAWSLHRPLPGRSHHLWVPSNPRLPWPTLVSPPQTPSPSLLIPV